MEASISSLMIVAWSAINSNPYNLEGSAFTGGPIFKRFLMAIANPQNKKQH